LSSLHNVYIMSVSGPGQVIREQLFAGKTASYPPTRNRQGTWLDGYWGDMSMRNALIDWDSLIPHAPLRALYDLTPVHKVPIPIGLCPVGDHMPHS
jgi:hypothetical protein